MPFERIEEPHLGIRRQRDPFAVIGLAGLFVPFVGTHLREGRDGRHPVDLGIERERLQGEEPRKQQ